MLLQLNAYSFNINLIKAYALTAEQPDQERKRFYNLIKQTRRNDINLIMGEINANVGKRKCNVGKCGLDQGMK